jgi:hypothetical protein
VKSTALAAFVPLLLIIGCSTPHSTELGTAPLEPRRAVIPKLSGEVKLDGRLDDPVWRRAAVLQPFFPNRGEGRDSEATEVRLWYDDIALHLGWVCTDRDIQATLTNRDSMFWNEEVVEFFVTPDKLEQYFELQWNPLGGVFDAIIHNQLAPDGVSQKFTGDWSYTAKGMRSAVHVDGTVGNSADVDRRWTVEVTVPFSDLGLGAPKPGTVWRGNFYRFSRGANNPEQQLAWSPTRLPGFHQPSRFGYLEFGR